MENDQNLPTTRIFLYSDPTANKITLWDIIALVMVCGLKKNPYFSPGHIWLFNTMYNKELDNLFNGDDR